MDLNSLLTSVFFGPLGYLSTAAHTLVEYVGSCVSGSCNSLSDTFVNTLTGIAGDTIAWITGAPAIALFGIFDFLPDGGGFPQTFHDAVLYFGNALASVSFILPVNVLADCVTSILAVKLALWSLHLVRVGVSFVRGVQVERYEWTN